MAWASGASKQLMNVLHHACLSMSYTSASAIITALADSSIAKAKIAASRPHALAYDNINISTSIFVEQGPNTLSKVQSGTFAVIYELLNARPEHMQIEPMVENLRKSTPLKLDDLSPTTASMKSFKGQTSARISQVLMKYVDGFDVQKRDPLLQHTERRALPKGHKTIFHPLRATTIEEATVEGNLHVHDDVYMVQLGKTEEGLTNTAIPSYNDQLTNARIRGAQILRRKDITPWERRDIFHLAFGGFHLAMNLIWSILENHRGSINQLGSFTHLFAVLEKTRLGAEHPDYHTLLAALTQVLHGLLLNSWRTECKYSTLDEFAKSNPSPQAILDLAHHIMDKYTIPVPNFAPTNPKAPPKDLNMHILQPDNTAATGNTSESAPPIPANADPVLTDSTSESETRPEEDIVHRNIILLTRDLLYVTELVEAMASGDFGRIEDILPTLACMFRGAGSNNYSTEILHLLFNIKKVWTPEFA